MSDRTPIDEPGQKEYQFRSSFNQVERHKSYDLTQRLTFFVVGIEAVFSGYILQNVRALSNVHGLEWLFLSCSLAFVLGIAWRFLYNEEFHRWAHGTDNSKWFKVLKEVRQWTYIIYVVFSFVSLLAAVAMGFFTF